MELVCLFVSWLVFNSLNLLTKTPELMGPKAFHIFLFVSVCDCKFMRNGTIFLADDNVTICSSGQINLRHRLWEVKWKFELNYARY
jgi:hypothetical protein